MSGMKQSPIDLDDTMPAWIHAPIEYRNYFAKDDTRFAETIHHNKVIIYKALKVSVGHSTLGVKYHTFAFQNLGDGIP